MRFRLFEFIDRLLSLFCAVAILGSATPAMAQTMPSFPAPPQQMTPTDVPPSYPSTASGWRPPGANQPGPAGPPASPWSDNGLVGIAQRPPDAAGRAGDAYGDAGAMRFPNNDGSPGPYDDVGPLPATPVAPARPLDLDASVERTLSGDEPWTWQVLPEGLMYKSYLAGNREPRFSTQIVYDHKQGWLWDSTLGARVGILRYGTDDPILPEGWQVDLEGAAFPRLDLPQRDLLDIDFRAGMPITRREGPWEMKFGYFHYCSHLGDEYILNNPGVNRINYVRETLIFGLAAYLSPDLRIYSEVGWAFHTDGGAEPWDFQFGAELCSTEPTGPGGSPFAAINCHLHQEVNFSGNLTVQAGWLWRGRTGHSFRVGMQYFNGMSDQAQFFQDFDEYIGLGLWYDY